MSEPGPHWHRALAYALCGEDQAQLTGRPEPDPVALVQELEEAGWDRTTLARHAEETRRAGRPWPHPVPADLVAELPAARFAAVLRALAAECGPMPAPPRVRTSATHRASAADERLLRDVPPHFGKL